ncbi:MAG: hypothetical protein WB689_09850 [Xanthobacteraceae bacterium]
MFDPTVLEKLPRRDVQVEEDTAPRTRTVTFARLPDKVIELRAPFKRIA